MKGASINATLRVLAKEDLYKMQVAVQARAKRQKGDQRVVSKGGLISAKDGRLKVSQIKTIASITTLQILIYLSCTWSYIASKL
jgi:hypothetical protein